MRFAACLVACLLLSSCAFPGSVKPTVKIGLSAPFEGLYRDLGYEVLYATRLAVRERNAAGGVAGRYLVELVALNDFNEPRKRPCRLTRWPPIRACWACWADGRQKPPVRRLPNMGAWGCRSWRLKETRPSSARRRPALPLRSLAHAGR